MTCSKRSRAPISTPEPAKLGNNLKNSPVHNRPTKISNKVRKMAGAAENIRKVQKYQKTQNSPEAPQVVHKYSKHELFNPLKIY